MNDGTAKAAAKPGMTNEEARMTKDSSMVLNPGSQLGSYLILEPLGKGGMGEVYRARDPRLGREVAIKIIRSDGPPGDDSQVRFEREARMLAAFNHANIATIHGLEEADGRRFLIMELVPGDTLAETLSKGRLATYRIMEIARQIADGLEAAHARGIIHRDLKPANIKVTPDGKVKLLDFGLAKALVANRCDGALVSTLSEDLTGPGAVLGTPAYMSPEQARGLSVDATTDVWAFGCILFEMLTGRRPFAGATSADLVVAILEREPSWSLLARETPPRLRQLLQNCLAKDARQRPADMGQVRRELNAVVTQMRSPGQTAVTTRSYDIPTVLPAPAEVLPAAAVIVDEPPMVLPAPTKKKEQPSVRPLRRQSNWPWVFAALALLTLVLCAGGYYGVVAVSAWVGRIWENAPFGAPANSVAVLPFEFGGPFNEDGENLAAAVNRELVQQAPMLRVTAHSASVKHRDPKMAAAFLDIRWAVTGKIERRGADFIIHAELIDVQTQAATWNGSFPARTTTDPEAARAIAAGVRAHFAKDAIKK
jgi:serine/threonine protein kinase/TolB-like protein